MSAHRYIFTDGRFNLQALGVILIAVIGRCSQMQGRGQVGKKAPGAGDMQANFGVRVVAELKVVMHQQHATGLPEALLPSWLVHLHEN